MKTHNKQLQQEKFVDKEKRNATNDSTQDMIKNDILCLKNQESTLSCRLQREIGIGQCDSAVDQLLIQFIFIQRFLSNSNLT